jgi:hypothetical protein
MTRLYASPAIQVRDGAGYPQDAVMGARGKPQPGDGVFQQLFAFGRNRVMLADHLRDHLCVRVSFFSLWNLSSCLFRAAVRKQGSGFDLPMTLGLVGCQGQFLGKQLDKMMFLWDNRRPSARWK